MLGDGLCSASRGDGVNVCVLGRHVLRVIDRKVRILFCNLGIFHGAMTEPAPMLSN